LPERFQLIAGERRWRAAQRAGLTKVSRSSGMYFRRISIEMTLVENIQPRGPQRNRNGSSIRIA